MRTKHSNLNSDPLTSVVDNAIARRLGVSANAPIQDFLAALTGAASGAPVLTSGRAHREVPYSQRLLAEAVAAQAGLFTAAVRRLRPIGCCTKTVEAGKTVEAIAGAAREIVAALESGVAPTNVLISGKLSLIGTELLGRLERLYGLSGPAQSLDEENRKADFAQVLLLLKQVRAALEVPAQSTASGALPAVREKGEALACRIDNAVEALDANANLECRWRLEPVADMQLGNLMDWTRAFAASEVPELMAGFGAEVSGSLAKTLDAQLDLWKKVGDAPGDVAGKADIVAAIEALKAAVKSAAPAEPAASTSTTYAPAGSKS